MTDGYTNLTKKDLPEGYEKYRDMIVDFVIRERKNIEQVSEKDLQMVLRASEREAAASHFLNPDRPTLKEFVRDLLKEKDVKSG